MKIEIRKYRPDEDAPRIQSLIDACYGAKGVSMPSFRHWHFGHERMVQGMMVAIDDSSIVGIQPMELLPHHLQGREILAGILTGVMVHPAYRRHGIFTRLIAACEARAWEHGARLVWTMPNDQSYAGFIKMGYKNPGERRLHVWLPDPRRLFARRLPAWLASAVGWGVRPWLSRLPGIESEDRAEELDGSDTRLGGVGVGCSQTWSGLIQSRDQAWIDWRFHRPEGTGYRFFGSVDAKQALHGWAATTVEEREGFRVGYLVDWIGENESARRVAGRAALESLNREDVEIVLAAVASRVQQRELQRLGLWRTPRRLAPKRFYTVFRPAPDLTETEWNLVRDIRFWYQSFGDWDTI